MSTTSEGRARAVVERRRANWKNTPKGRGNPRAERRRQLRAQIKQLPRPATYHKMLRKRRAEMKQQDG